jgi:hypothetical protein
VKREVMLRELRQLYKKLEDLQAKRAQKSQMLEISEKIKELLRSMVDDLDGL